MNDSNPKSNVAQIVMASCAVITLFLLVLKMCGFEGQQSDEKEKVTQNEDKSEDKKIIEDLGNGFKIQYLGVTQNKEQLEIKFSFYVSPTKKDTNHITFYSGDNNEKGDKKKITYISINGESCLSSFISFGTETCYNKKNPKQCSITEYHIPASTWVDGSAFFKGCPETNILSTVHLTFAAQWGSLLTTKKTNLIVKQI